MLLGYMEFAESMYNGRNEPTLLPYEDKILSGQLAEVIAKLPENIYKNQESFLDLSKHEGDHSIPVSPGLENHAFITLFYSIFTREGSIMVLYDKQTGTTAERIKGMILWRCQYSRKKRTCCL